MAIILVPTDAVDFATAIGMANPNDAIRGEVIGSPFQGANNRNIDPGGLDPLIIEGETGNPVDVVIDCQDVAATRGFYFHTGETAASVVRNLSIINGKDSKGAGICIINSSPTITNVIIDDCDALGTEAGGGIFTDYSSSTISDFIIRNCSGYTGGGIELEHSSGATLNNGQIYNNAAHGTTGGGLHIHTGSPFVKNCLFYNNTAMHGGGVSMFYCSATFRDCTITTNTVTTSGGGVYHDTNGSPNFYDTIIWNNSAPAGWGRDIYARVQITCHYCDVKPHDADWVNTWPNLIRNNCIDADPEFIAGPGGDYYLNSEVDLGVDSPCIDTGSDTAVNLGMDTRTTRTDEGLDSGQVDMGWHYAPALPDQASNPNPGNGDAGIELDQELGWGVATGANSYDVYFGTDEAAVTAADHGSPEFKGNQPGISYDPDIDCGTTYYWRVDTVNAAGTVTGEVWSFTTLACFARIAYTRMRWGSVG